MITSVTSVANDNVLDRVRPLSGDDIEIIITDHALVLATALDAVAAQVGSEIDQIRSSAVTLANLPAMQKDIVWRGSWLKRQAVDGLNQADLLNACVGVLAATRSEYAEGEVEAFICELLRPHSTHLRAG